MRELTKSVLSFSWGMSLFGINQVANLLTPQSLGQPSHKMASALNSVTYAVEEQLDDSIQKTFQIGDQLQRKAVDVVSGFLALEGINPGQLLKLTSRITRPTPANADVDSQRAPSDLNSVPLQGGFREC
jgi:hypothetical protein